jgi:hypothetical protein
VLSIWSGTVRAEVGATADGTGAGKAVALGRSTSHTIPAARMHRQAPQPVRARLDEANPGMLLRT